MIVTTKDDPVIRLVSRGFGFNNDTICETEQVMSTLIIVMHFNDETKPEMFYTKPLPNTAPIVVTI